MSNESVGKNPGEQHEDVPGELLWHPVNLVAVAVIVINNFVLKVHYPGWLSGKLSDFGLCVFAPIWLHAIAEWGWWIKAQVAEEPWMPLTSKRAAFGCCALLGAYFVALQLSPVFAQFHVDWLSLLVSDWNFQVTRDPTDLIALPFLAVPYLLIRRRTNQ